MDCDDNMYVGVLELVWSYKNKGEQRREEEEEDEENEEVWYIARKDVNEIS